MNINEKYYWIISTFTVPVCYAITVTLFYLLLYNWKLPVFMDKKIQEPAITCEQLKAEVMFTLISLVIFCCAGFGVYLIYQNGYSKLYFEASKYGWIYLPLSIVIMVVLHDAYFYWTHRLLHTKWWFRNVHQTHHRSSNPSPWAALSFHPAEAFIQAFITILIVLFIPAHPIALFIFLVYMVLKNVLGHTGYELTAFAFKNTWWQQWRNTSTHHNNHHLYGRDNYGLYFTFWDKLMRTHREKKK